ncbi:hypothetical protein CR513_01729, partial [Mucuna pruriens]
MMSGNLYFDLKTSLSLEQNGSLKTNMMRMGYLQQEGIDFTETFALVSRLDAIHILLSFAAPNNMRLYQMSVKSSFFNGIINEEVYVKQEPSFENDYFAYHVFKLKKTLYGLKQTPCAWYEKLSSFLKENSFSIEKLGTTLFHKDHEFDFILVQIYVDDIVFGAKFLLFHYIHFYNMLYSLGSHVGSSYLVP